MSLFQILDCSTTIGTCCDDFALSTSLDSLRKLLDLVQLLVPIILIIWSTVEFIKLMNDPEAKNGIKKVVNKYIAAIVVFFVPTFVNAVLGIMPDSFSVSSCWQQAKVNAEITRTLSNTYVSPYNSDVKMIVANSDDYEKGNERKTPTPAGENPSSAGNGSATGKAIVEYALKFVGQPYVFGGTWNGELPYTGTDCSGFVQGVFRHFGIRLQRNTYSQWDDTGAYTIVSPGDIRAGDLVMYDGHVAILTGNGTQVVHAKCTKCGIVTDSDYRTCSSHAIKGIMRINGVN